MAEKGDFQAEPVSAKETSSSLAGIKCNAFKFAPYVAVGSGILFGANLMSPSVISRPFGSKSVLVQNACFALAHIGTGMYIYQHTPHKDAHKKMILFSAAGSVIFNYGTVLVLANVKHYLPQSQMLRCLIAMGVVGGLFWTGKEYLNHVEPSQVD